MRTLVLVCLLASLALASGSRIETSWQLRRIAHGLLQEGRKADALRTLGHLVDLDVGYDPGNDMRTFGALAETPEFKALTQRARRRLPARTGSREAFTVAEPGLIPEGIAYDPVDRAFYLGSISGRKILRIDLEGRLSEFVPADSEGLGEVLGLHVDVKRRILWAASNATGACGVWGFDLATGRLKRKAVIPRKGNLINDLAVTPDGNLLATDSGASRILQLRAEGSQLEVLEVPVHHPNGLAISEDGRILFVSEAGSGILRIDLRTLKARPLAGPPGICLLGIDGLYARGRSLVAVHNGFTSIQVVHYRLDPRLERVVRAEVLDRRDPASPLPTTGAIAGGWFYFMANTQVDRHRNGAFTAGPPLEPIRVRKIRLPRL